MEAPQKSETPAGAGPLAEQTKTDSVAIVSHAAADCNTTKSLATLKARSAIAGHAVHEVAPGRFVVVRPDWGGVRECCNVAELHAFARILGVLP